MMTRRFARFLFGIFLIAGNLLAGGRNKLPNGDFSDVSFLGKQPYGWSYHGDPNGSVSCDAGVVRITCPPSSGSKQWNMLVHPLPGLKPNTPYTMSAWIRTKGVTGGSLAYLSLNGYAGKTRRQTCDSPMLLSGDREWTCVSVRIPRLEKGVVEAKAHLCLYGFGTAEFKEVQVREGSEIQPFSPYEDVLDVRMHRVAWQKEAELWATRHSLTNSRKRIAVLDPGVPPGRGAKGWVSQSETIAKSLSRLGVVSVLNGREVCNPFLLDAKIFDLFVVPCADLYPAEGKDALVRFLRKGGNLITMGGYAFDTPVYQSRKGWTSVNSISRDGLRGTFPFPFPSVNRMKPRGNSVDKVDVHEVDGPNGKKGIMVSTPYLTGWATCMCSVPENLPQGWSVVSLWVKGDAKTPRMWLEYSERDGSRWHCALDLTPEWREVTLTADQFTYWSDNPSTGRGWAGDIFRPENAAWIQFGVAIDLSLPYVKHCVSVADVRVGMDANRHLREKQTPNINARYGVIRDQLTPRPEQIRVFDASFLLEDGAVAECSEEVADLLPAFSVKGKMGGYSAVGQLGENGHGFGPVLTRWTPLLTCKDSKGAVCGHAGAFLRHYAGTFAGSSWAIFGVTESDLFGPGAETFLPAVAKTLLRRCFLTEAGAEFCSYERGETVKISCSVLNANEAPRRAEVRFFLSDERGRELWNESRTVTLLERATTSVEGKWVVPTNAPDVVFLRAELWLDGVKRDVEKNAFCVWTPSVAENGTRLALEGTRFSFDGKSYFGMGCQTWWGQIHAPSARSVMRFIQDFPQMRNAGLRWTRQFLRVESKAEQRFSDAMVQLSQKYGLVLYHTPNLFCVAEKTEREKEENAMRWIASRYRNVKGFCVDLCNEPATKFDNAFDKAFGRKAKPVGDARDAETCATWSKVAEVERDWARVLHDAGRTVRSDLLLSVGWSQGWGGDKEGKDVTYASLDLDFTDRHYYGKWENFGPEIKDLDLRVLGKPYLVGECGAKCHPTFVECDPWQMGETEEEYSSRFKYLAYHAFGLGAGSLLSWHWRDPMEGCFPCGQVHSTGVPRQSLKIFSECARTLGALELAENPPDTVLLQPTSRMNSGERWKAIMRMRTLQRILQSCGVNYSVLPEVWLEKHLLPGEIKLVIRPDASASLSDGVKHALDCVTSGGGKIWSVNSSAEIVTRAAALSVFRQAGVFTAWNSGDPETVEVFRVPVWKDRVAGKKAFAWVFWNNATSGVFVVRGGDRIFVPARDGVFRIER